MLWAVSNRRIMCTRRGPAGGMRKIITVSHACASHTHTPNADSTIPYHPSFSLHRPVPLHPPFSLGHAFLRRPPGTFRPVSLTPLCRSHLPSPRIFARSCRADRVHGWPCACCLPTRTTRTECMAQFHFIRRVAIRSQQRRSCFRCISRRPPMKCASRLIWTPCAVSLSQPHLVSYIGNWYH